MDQVCKYTRHLHEANTIVLSMVFAINRTKLYLFGANITEVRLFDYAIYMSADLLW